MSLWEDLIRYEMINEPDEPRKKPQMNEKSQARLEYGLLVLKARALGLSVETYNSVEELRAAVKELEK